MEANLVVFKDKQIRRILLENEWHFAVVDVVAVLTDSDKPRDYWYRLKKRELESSGLQLSTNCRQLKLIFSMLGEAATTEITRVDDARGFKESRSAARRGGEVAGKARKDLERKTRKKVVSPENYLVNPQKEHKRLNK
jgi:hypothetical protein